MHIFKRIDAPLPVKITEGDHVIGCFRYRPEDAQLEEGPDRTGIWQYRIRDMRDEMYLEAIADPEHDEHDWMVECYGGPHDPENPETDAIIEGLERLAKKWAPRPRKPKTPTS